jgi:hypothetical protein
MKRITAQWFRRGIQPQSSTAFSTEGTSASLNLPAGVTSAVRLQERPKQKGLQKRRKGRSQTFIDPFEVSALLQRESQDSTDPHLTPQPASAECRKDRIAAEVHPLKQLQSHMTEIGSKRVSMSLKRKRGMPRRLSPADSPAGTDSQPKKKRGRPRTNPQSQGEGSQISSGGVATSLELNRLQKRRRSQSQTSVSAVVHSRSRSCSPLCLMDTSLMMSDKERLRMALHIFAMEVAAAGPSHTSKVQATPIANTTVHLRAYSLSTMEVMAFESEYDDDATPLLSPVEPGREGVAYHLHSRRIAVASPASGKPYPL